MSSPSDYFANHRLKMRLPWRLYHGPIVDAVSCAIRDSGGRDVLNIGSGPFFEFEALPKEGRRYFICDIDARAIDLARTRLGPRLAGARVVDSECVLAFDDAAFDLVFATEVIEHLHEPLQWTKEVLRVLRPGGTLLLTTPNYESLSLNLIERTLLEAIARMQGFSRAQIHPSRFDRDRLRAVLERAGAHDVHVQVIAHGWVLAAHARRPR